MQGLAAQPPPDPARAPGHAAALCWRRQGGSQPGNATFSFSLRSPGRVPQAGGQGRAGRKPRLAGGIAPFCRGTAPLFFSTRAPAAAQNRCPAAPSPPSSPSACRHAASMQNAAPADRGPGRVCDNTALRHGYRPTLAVRPTSRRPRRSWKITAASSSLPPSPDTAVARPPPPPPPLCASGHRRPPFARTGAGAKEGGRAAPRGRRGTAPMGIRAAPCALQAGQAFAPAGRAGRRTSGRSDRRGARGPAGRAGRASPCSASNIIASLREARRGHQEHRAPRHTGGRHENLEH